MAEKVQEIFFPFCSLRDLWHGSCIDSIKWAHTHADAAFPVPLPARTQRGHPDPLSFPEVGLT